MKKVLIVDDDFIVRTYLKQMLAWEEKGYLLQDAKNGQEALDICQQLQPDIVITDMSMPIMNGIDLIKNLKSKYPKINIIVLSCHDDFSYVKEAMKLGVEDYLLKNDLTPENLLDALNKINIQYEEYEWGLSKEELAIIGKKKVLNDFFSIFDSDKNDNKRLMELAKLANIHSNFQSSICVLVELHEWEIRKMKYSDEDKQNFYQAFKEMLKNICQNEVLSNNISCYIFKSVNVESFWGILIDFENEHSMVKLNKYIQNLAEKINLFVKRYFDLSTSCYISEVCRSLEGLKQHWLNLKNLSDWSFYEQKSIYWEVQRKILKTEMPNYLLELNQELVDLSIQMNEKVFQDKLEQFLNLLLNEKFTIKILRKIIENLEAKVKYQEKLDWENIKNYNSLKEEIEKFFSRIKQRSLIKVEHPAIRKALKWIDEHYKEPISQQMVADYVYLNTAYFSSLFSKSMGKTFSEYLMNYRIQKVQKRLERSNEKIKEIALTEGFIDYQYFCKVFKKLIGINPSEYRQRLK